MNIWIFNHHALTPDMPGGTRHFDFAKELISKGDAVTIFASSFHYAKHEELKNYGSLEFLEEDAEGVSFVWFKTRPYKGNGVDRVRNMLDYMRKTMRIVPKLPKEKPDIIIGSSVHLFAVYAAYKIADKLRVPFVMEVRDLWPKTLIDMGMSKWHPFIMLLGTMEKFLYRKAKKIITLLPEAHRYIEALGIPNERIVWISNGVDTNKINYYKKEPSDEFLVIYSGALGIANNIDLLVEAAYKLQEQEQIKFLIIGNGPEKEALKKKIDRYGLKNVKIHDAVPKHEISRYLTRADVFFFNLKDSPVFKYGISSNKLFDYMAAGRPVVFACNAINNPVQDARGGITIPAENLDALVQAIEELYKMDSNQREEMGLNAKKYVLEHFSISVLAEKLEEQLKEVHEMAR